MQTLVKLAAIAVIALGCWWFFAMQTGLVPGPSQVLQSKPVPVSKTFTVAARQQTTWTVPPPAGKTPGTLHGRRSSRGKSAGLRGATDDTLVAFRLLAPNNQVLQTLDHPTGGNFSVRYDERPGSYTMVFDNAGILRSSPREVTIDGTYQPD